MLVRQDWPSGYGRCDGGAGLPYQLSGIYNDHSTTYHDTHVQVEVVWKIVRDCATNHETNVALITTDIIAHRSIILQPSALEAFACSLNLSMPIFATFALGSKETYFFNTLTHWAWYVYSLIEFRHDFHMGVIREVLRAHQAAHVEEKEKTITHVNHWNTK